MAGDVNRQLPSQACTYPLTGVGCVSHVHTDHAIFDISEDGVSVRRTFGIDLDTLRDRVDVDLTAG